MAPPHQVNPGGALVVLHEDFEGAWPGPWTIWANPSWGPDSYRAHGGSYSGFCAKSGPAGVDPPAHYLNNMCARIACGPLDLSGCASASLSFWLWQQVHSSSDYTAVSFSHDNAGWGGVGIMQDTSGWVKVPDDVDTYPDGVNETLAQYLGDDSVWLAFEFWSDDTGTDAGAFLDDITLSVTSGTPHRDYTVMVYLNGDNAQESAAIAALNEMEKGLHSADVNFLVQLDRHPSYDTSNGNWTTCRRYYVQGDGGDANINSTLLADLGEVNMGAAATLADFITWGVANYPADKYALILWGDPGEGWRSPHGKAPRSSEGKSLCTDATSGDTLWTYEWASAIRQANIPLQFVGLDASTNGMLENITAVELHDLVSAMAASPSVRSPGGFPYEQIRNNPRFSPAMTGLQLADYIVSWHNSEAPSYTMAAYDLTEHDAALDELDDLVSYLMSRDSNWAEVAEARERTQFYSYSRFRDLREFAHELMVRSSDENLRLRAADLCDALDQLVPSFHSGGNYADGRGLGISFPETGPEGNYASSAFAAASGWDEFLTAFGNADKVRPSPPVLHPISNPDGCASFCLEWDPSSDASGISNYTIQQFNISSTLFSDDAESGLGAWDCVNFMMGTASYHTPTHSFGSASGNNLYCTMSNAAAVHLPASSTCYLTYWASYDIMPDGDQAVVQVSDNDGVNWQTLGRYSGADGWARHCHDLSPLAGANVKLRFVYVTNGSGIGSGISFDDIKIISLNLGSRWNANGSSTSGCLSQQPVGASFYAMTATDNAGNTSHPSNYRNTNVTNHYPTIAGVEISPSPARANQDLTATPTCWSDADGDPEGYRWGWEIDDGSGWTWITGEHTSTLDHSHFSAWDKVRVTCIPDDGKDTGPARYDEVVIRGTPYLSWLGTPGYLSDAHKPNRGSHLDWYEFRVRYTGMPPTRMRLRLFRYGVEVAGSPIDMNPGAGDPMTGQVFWYKRRLTKGTYSYYFRASDGVDNAIGDPVTHETVGPIVHNRAPRLEWRGAGAWTSDPVDPQGRQMPGTEFTWKIKYIDREGDPPEYVRLHLARRTMVGGTPVDTELAQSPFEMTPAQPDYARDDYMAGAIFRFTKTLSQEARYLCWFSAKEHAPAPFTSQQAYGVPTWWKRNMVWIFNAPPQLWWAPGVNYRGDSPSDGLHPNVGNAGATFTFRVQYRDPEGAEPHHVRLHLLRWNGSDYVPVGASPFEMSTSDTDFTKANYSVQVVRNHAGQFRYYFRANDGDKSAVGEPTWHRMPGPTVSATSSVPAQVKGISCLPTLAGAQVTFTLSADAAVTAEVLNIAGRPVRLLVSDHPMPTGTNTLAWDGRNSAGLAVPAGAYLVRLKAATASGGQGQALAMVRIDR